MLIESRKCEYTPKSVNNLKRKNNYIYICLSWNKQRCLIFVHYFLSEQGTRDSVQTDLKERKRRTKRVSSMQKPAYEQFLKERRDVQKYVSNERR